MSSEVDLAKKIIKGEKFVFGTVTEIAVGVTVDAALNAIIPDLTGPSKVLVGIGKLVISGAVGVAAADYVTAPFDDALKIIDILNQRSEDNGSVAAEDVKIS